MPALFHFSFRNKLIINNAIFILVSIHVKCFNCDYSVKKKVKNRYKYLKKKERERKRMK